MQYRDHPVPPEYKKLGLSHDHVQTYCTLRDAQIGSFVRKYGKFYKLMAPGYHPICLVLASAVKDLVEKEIIRLDAMDEYDSIVIVLNPFL